MVTGRMSLTRAGVLPDLVVGERRALEQLVAPLARGDGVGDEDERRRAGHRHRGRADDRLARAAREHDHAGPAVPEALCGLALVAAQLPALLAQRDRVRLAVDVAGVVLGRPAELEQDLLEVTALGRVHHDGVLLDARTDERLDLLAAQHLLEHRAVVGVQHEAVRRVHLELQPAVAAHRVGDVDEQRVRHGVARVAQQRRRRRPRRRGPRRARSRGRVGSGGTCGCARAPARARRTGRSRDGTPRDCGWSISRRRVLSLCTIRGPSVIRRSSHPGASAANAQATASGDHRSRTVGP